MDQKVDLDRLLEARENMDGKDLNANGTVQVELWTEEAFIGRNSFFVTKEEVLPNPLRKKVGWDI